MDAPGYFSLVYAEPLVRTCIGLSITGRLYVHLIVALVIEVLKRRTYSLAIPNSQLETWSGRGAVTTAKNTRQAVYDALTNGLMLSPSDYDVYLQGSYGNVTNIWADSDVDIVVELTLLARFDLSQLNAFDEQTVRQTMTPPSTTLDEFRTDVIGALEARFGRDAVTLGHKCVKIAPAPSRHSADVVVAHQYRRYFHNLWNGKLLYHRGVIFEALPERREIVNFPKQHHDNGESKMKPHRTNGQFKPVVRIFKNMRNCLVERGYIDADLAPSYHLQCLIYNAPDPFFTTDPQKCVHNILSWICGMQWSELATFRCQNGIDDLFGPLPEQWDVANAQIFAWKARELWLEWR